MTYFFLEAGPQIPGGLHQAAVHLLDHGVDGQDHEGKVVVYHEGEEQAVML